MSDHSPRSNLSRRQFLNFESVDRHCRIVERLCGPRAPSTGVPEQAEFFCAAMDQSMVLARPLSPPAAEFYAMLNRELDLLFLGDVAVEDTANAIKQQGDEILAVNLAFY